MKALPYSVKLRMSVSACICLIIGSSQILVAQISTNAMEAVLKERLQLKLTGPSTSSLLSTSRLIAATNSVRTELSRSRTPIVSSSFQPPAVLLPEEIRVQGGFAVAEFGPHKARFGNPNTLEAVELTVPTRTGAIQLRSHVVGICYYVPGTDVSVLLGVPKDSGGEIHLNKVIFRNAMEGIDADIRYTYGRSPALLEQDIILRTKLPDPRSVGVVADSGDLRVAVISELLDPPMPLRKAGTIDLTTRYAAAGASGTASLPCETLFFGAMQIPGEGKAFLLGDSGAAVSTAITFEQIDGSWYLIESTPYALIKAQIDSLPEGTLHAKIGKRCSLRSMLASLPHVRGQRNSVNTSGVDTTKMVVANADADAGPGVVLDYLIVSSPIINVDLSPGSPAKTGYAAIGQATNDYWNAISFSGSSSASLPHLTNSDRTASSVGMVISNAPGQWGFWNEDAMYGGFIYGSGTISVTITNLATNVYDIYLYGHGGGDPANTLFKLYRTGTQIGYKGTTLWGSGWNSTNWEAGQQFVVFRNISVTNQTLRVDVPPGGDGYPYINGMQIAISSSVPPESVSVSNLINIDFSGASPAKVGKAAVGLATNDVWNSYSNPWNITGNLANLTNANSSTSSVGVTVLNAPGSWGFSPGDAMYSGFIYSSDGGNITVTVTNLPSGIYNFYLYGHTGGEDDNTVFQLWAGDREYGVKGTTIWGSGSQTNIWDEGQQYVVYRDVEVKTNESVVFLAGHSVYAYAMLNGMQIVYKGAADSDGDGLPDAWEISHFGSLTRSSGGTNDVDGDGLTDLREYQLGTNPTRTDSNLDGVSDVNDPEFVWVEDAIPNSSYANDGDAASPAWAGATTENWNWTDDWYDGDGWGGAEISGYSAFWYTGDPMMHISDLATNIHQHWFDNGVNNIRANTGDVLICYINIDSTHRPSEAMLQWYVRNDDGNCSWEHRAYWGSNSISWGTNGTASRYFIGSLPAGNQWVRLEVPAVSVGLEGRVIQGMAFTLYNGRAAWDRAGKVIPDLDANGLPDAWEMQYFGHVGVDPNSDPDGDGLNNIQEYNRGTDPTIQNSPFRILIVRPDGSSAQP
jgi:hypothetical protein